MNAYPLTWPAGWPRTSYWQQGPARFDHKRTLAQAIDGLLDELEHMNATDIVISTNLALRNDGLPRSGQPRPKDVGVAVYFKRRVQRASVRTTKDYAMPCDRFDRIEDNVWAIAQTIAATRKIERYGVASLDRAFDGFAALPAAGQTSGDAWWDVLQVDRNANIEAVQAAYRALARKAHPDAGGSDDAMARLNAARDAALTSKSGA